MVRTMLRRRAVEQATGLSRSTIYAMIARGEFPKPVPLGLKAVGWPEDEIEAWLAARAAKRDGDPSPKAA